MTSERTTPSVIGSEIAGYRILNEVARGAAGVVYRARQISLNRTVALKVMLQGADRSEQEVARFYAEAQAIAKLRHPNIVPVFDVGPFADSHYIAMAFVEGRTLGTAAAQKRFTPKAALIIVEKVARALERAHQAGIVHRDVKPGNIMLDTQGDVQVMDFGLAKQMESEIDLTRSGVTLGTPNYMSPEQARGDKDVDARSDIYALGTVLYELLTGQAPHADDSNLKTILKVINEEPLPPRKLTPQVAKDVQTICLKAMEKSPSRRYRSAQAMADDIRRFLNNEPIEARPASNIYKLSKWLTRHRVAAAIVLFAILAASLLTTVLGPPTPAPVVITTPPRDNPPPILPTVEPAKPTFVRWPAWSDDLLQPLTDRWQRPMEGRWSRGTWQTTGAGLRGEPGAVLSLEVSQPIPGDMECSILLKEPVAAGGRFAWVLGGAGPDRKEALRAVVKQADDGSGLAGAMLYQGTRLLAQEKIPLRETRPVRLTLRRWGNKLTLLMDKDELLSKTVKSLPTVGGRIGFQAEGSGLLLADFQVDRLLPDYDTLMARAASRRDQGQYAAAWADYNGLLVFYIEQKNARTHPSKHRIDQLTYWRQFSALGRLGLFAQEPTYDTAAIQSAIDALDRLAQSGEPGPINGDLDPIRKAEDLKGALLVRLHLDRKLDLLKTPITPLAYIDAVAKRRGEDAARVFAGVLGLFELELQRTLRAELTSRPDLNPTEIELIEATKLQVIAQAEAASDFTAAAEGSLDLARFYLDNQSNGTGAGKAISLLELALQYDSLSIRMAGRLRNQLGETYFRESKWGEADAVFRTDLKRLLIEDPLIGAEAVLGLARIAAEEKNFPEVIRQLDQAHRFETGAIEPKFPEPAPLKPTVQDPDSPEGLGMIEAFKKEYAAWAARQEAWNADHKKESMIWALIQARAGSIRRRMLTLLAEAYKRIGSFDNSRKTLATLASLAEQPHAEQARALQAIGDLYRLEEDYEQAHQAYWNILMQFVELRTTCAKARIRLGENYVLAEQYALADEQFAKLEDRRYAEEQNLRMEALNKRGLNKVMWAREEPGLGAKEKIELLTHAAQLWKDTLVRFPLAQSSNPHRQIAQLLSLSPKQMATPAQEQQRARGIKAYEAVLQKETDPKRRARLRIWLAIRHEIDQEPDRARSSYNALASDELNSEWPALWANRRLKKMP